MEEEFKTASDLMNEGEVAMLAEAQTRCEPRN
jgi:hypothetical protein